MNYVKSVQLSWADVSRLIASELQSLLGRRFACLASMDDHEYWSVSLSNSRIELSELRFVFDVVKAETQVKEDTYGDDGDISFSSLGMGLSDLLLKRSLGFSWVNEFVDKGSLILINVRETPLDDSGILHLKELDVDMRRLKSVNQLLAYLRENGATHTALMDFCEEYREKYHNELCWPYPISDGKHLGTFLVLVQEGILSLPYDTADEEDYETFRLDDVSMFDSGSMQEFIESWSLFDRDLHQAMYAMKRYLKNQEEQHEGKN